MPRTAKLVAQGASVAVVAGLLALLVWKVAHPHHAPKRAAPAPNFSLPRLDGEGKLELASLRGKAIVLNFWASWCVPCKQEVGRLEAASRQWAKRGVVVLGVDSQDFSGDAKAFARHYRLTYPLVHDGPGSARDSYGVTGFPETFFIDPRGRLVGEHVAGPVTRQQLEDNIRLALKA